MYTLNFDPDGKLAGATHALDDGTQRYFVIGTREWQEFLAWNAAQPAPLVLADKPAEDVQAAKVAARRAAAIAFLTTSNEPLAIAIRIVAKGLGQSLREVRSKGNLPNRSDEQFIGDLVAALQAGGGEV